MANENAKKFWELVEQDAELQKKIQEADAAFAKENEGASQEEAFAAILAPIAKEAGFEFTAEELAESMKALNDELSQDELDKVAGGAFFCPIIGVSTRPEAAAGIDLKKNSVGVGACAYIGIGIGYHKWSGPLE